MPEKSLLFPFLAVLALMAVPVYAVAGLVSLTLTNLIRDHRCFVEKSNNLSAWYEFDDIIASGPSEPQAASADMVNQLLQEPLQDPAAFYRVWMEN